MKKIKYILLIFLLAACNFKPHYCRPEMAIPDTWRFDIGESEECVNLAWWEQFNDPDLNQLIRTALENNQNLQVATATVLEFFAKYQVTASKFFPQIYADGGVDREKLSKSVIFQPISSFIPRINNLFHLFVELLPYEIDFWGRIRNSVESAKYDYFGQVNARRNVIITLVSQVAAGYFQLKEYHSQLEISQLTYQSRLESWEIAKKRYDAGLISFMDVKQAESQAEDAQASIEDFKQLVAQQEDLLSTLIGAPSGPIAVGKSLKDLTETPSIPAGLPSDLLQSRPDIMQAEDALISANAQIGVARANFFPKFTITGIQLDSALIGQESSSLSQLLKEKANVFDAAFDVTQPIFTGGNLSGQLSESEAIFLENYHSYQQTVLTALQEVNDALIAHQIAKEKLKIQDEEIAALAEYLRLAKLRYANGQNDYLTVLNAETSLFQVQLNEVVTRANIFISLVNLYKALGHGWDVEAN